MSAGPVKKLLLVNPAIQVRKGFLNSDGIRFMPLALGIVAALTPPDWEVELLDESFEDFTFRPADLVAFTSYTSNAPRAYDIAAIYREAGIPTVMGGSHASTRPEEAAQYVDSVVKGEAEGCWGAVLSDVEAGSLKPFYDGGFADIRSIPHVRREIFVKYPYAYDLVQTTRGCPMGCDFCSVTHICGKTYREREIEDVLYELEETTRPLLFFIDDNLVNQNKGAEERAIRLFKGMVERKVTKPWLSQAAVNFGDNDEVLRWARKSGCVMILLGIEAETVNALKDTRKKLNLKRGTGSYRHIFKKIHSHGIGILAAMIFGMDSDSREDLFARRDFIAGSSADSYQCTILTPLPGTALFDRWTRKKQVALDNYPADWHHYHCMTATSDTQSMNRADIELAMDEIWTDLYNKEAMRRKMFRTLWNTRSFKTAYWAYACNYNYGRMFLEHILRSPDGALDAGFEWRNRKRSFFLRFTDVVILLFYQTKWKWISRLFNGN